MIFLNAKPYETAAVTNLQRYLLQLSFFDPTIPAVPIDGIFESVTRDAVLAFQRRHGLSVTGVADRETWDAIYRAYLKSLSDYARPEPVYIFPRYPDAYSVGRGDEGMLITAIQFLLRELLIDYGGMPEDIPQTGVFDAATERGIRQFQLLHGLSSTGRVDKATWDAMVLSNNADVDRYQKE